MKILKPGKVEMRKFVCPRCRCEFLATEQEKYLAHDDYYQSWMEVQCPCGVAIKWDCGEPYEEPTTTQKDRERLEYLIADAFTDLVGYDDREKVTEYGLLEKVYEAVSNAPEVGWIDIRDQKPEVGTEIIGMYAYGSIARFVVESESSYRKDCTAEYCNVDYWLPLPEVPEEYR